MLSFTLLGQVTLHKDGLPVEQFRSQKELALLVYLAHTGQAHPRDAVADLLWDGRTTKRVRSNLRTILARLRRQVDEDLLITRQTLALTPERLHRVDSARLLQALTGFGHVDSAQKAASLHQILRTYGGEFLADFYLSDAPQFDEWATMTREQIRRQVVVAHHKLTSYTLETGALDQGIVAARQWVQVDALNEMAHMTLIRLLLQGGNLPEAKAQYAECVRLLRTELDMDPPPELTALVQNASISPPIVLNGSPTARHNLPVPYDQFINRGASQKEIHSRLDRSWCRLVTIVGQGGVGKTRLALTVARSRLDRYRDGVWFVELENVDPEDGDLAEAIAVEIASVLDVRLSGTAKPTAQLLDHLAYKEMLLVLDNFDHLIHGVQVILDITKGCDRVQMIVTSREALRVRAEWTIDLAGLRYAANTEESGQSDAVALFVARRSQQRRDPLTADDMDAVRAICQMVEGLPLAIELAAALTRTASIPEVAERLQAGFDGLATSLRDVPERHRSLGVVFESSWQTLTPALQQRLARLSTFAGGFTVQAAQFVASATPQDLTDLYNKSLLSFDDDQDRYVLHPVVNAYAREKLAAGDPAPQNHIRYYLSLLATKRETLQGDQPQLAVAVIGSEIENVRLAWQTGMDPVWVEQLLAALEPLSVYHHLQGLNREAEALMRTVAQSAASWGEAGAGLAIRAGLELARFQNRLGRYRTAIQTLQRALTLDTRHEDAWAEGMGHVWWGESLWRMGDYGPARQKLHHALSVGTAIDSPFVVGWSHHQLGIIDDIQSRWDTALDHLRQADDLWRTLNNVRLQAVTLNSLGLVHHHQGDLSTAQDTLDQALALCTQIDYRYLQTFLLNSLSIIAIERDNLSDAQDYLERGLVLVMANGNLTSQADIHVNLGRNHRLLGQWALAVDHLQQGLDLAESIGDVETASIALLNLAAVKQVQGDDRLQAELLYNQALGMARQADLPRTACEALIGMAELLSKADEARARSFSAEAVTLADVLQNPDMIQRATSIHNYLTVSV